MDNITDEMPESGCEKKTVPQDQIQRETDYFRAQYILKAMLDKGLISLLEFNKITALNRQSFSPMLAGIMPQTVDNTGVQR